MRVLDIVAAVMLIVGGLNWGLVGLLQFDLVAALFGGADAVLARVVYTLVGLAAVYQAASIATIPRRWGMHPVHA